MVKVSDAQKNLNNHYLRAQDWYYQKFIEPKLHLYWLMFLTLISVAGCISIILFVYNSFSENNEIKLMIPGQENKIVTASRMGSISDNPSKTVNKFLISHFVKNMEEYDNFNQQKRLRFIKSNASGFVFRDFYKKNSLDNPESLRLRYNRDTARKISIDKIALSPDNTCKVFFTAKIVEGRRQQVISQSKHIVYIKYNTSDVSEFFKLKEKKEFKFTVNKYTYQKENYVTNSAS